MSRRLTSKMLETLSTILDAVQAGDMMTEGGDLEDVDPDIVARIDEWVMEQQGKRERRSARRRSR